MRTLVTGGLGFVGTKIVQALLAEGDEVRVLSLPVPFPASGGKQKFQTIVGDIRDSATVHWAMKGCQRVFHLAAYARNWSPDPNVFFDVNVKGTDVLLKQALDCGVERVVYTSSNLALGPSNGVYRSETEPRTTDFLTEYERSKFIAESLVRSYVRQGLDVVIVNPTRIYGPGPMDESNSVTKMILWYLQGKWRLVLGDGNARGNYVLVDDVVQGHLSAMKNGRPGENYILGGENASFNEFFDELIRISGRKHRLYHLPASIAIMFSKTEMTLARWFGLYPLITPGWARTFLTNWENSCVKAERELGYQPASLSVGLKQTIRWLEETAMC